MDKVRVAIYDEDVEYSKRLMNYLNGKYGEQIDAAAFSDKEHMVREVADYGFDCVVTNDVEDIGPISVVKICDKQTEEGYYRYGSAKMLAQKIVANQNLESCLSIQAGQMIAVYSILNANKRTEYAWKKAKELGGIYFGMEEFGGCDTEQYWMEELLFFIRERDWNICKQFEEHLIWKEGVRYLPSARCFLDYRYMSYEDYCWFLNKLSTSMNCPVIFDVGIGTFSDFRFFSLFDNLFFLTGNREEGKKKETVFLNLLSQEVENIHEKIVFVEEKVE
jgi:hypothetical protein